jgi:hypothetical protein
LDNFDSLKDKICFSLNLPTTIAAKPTRAAQPIIICFTMTAVLKRARKIKMFLMKSDSITSLPCCQLFIMFLMVPKPLGP